MEAPKYEYFPEFFNVANEADAKRIILTRSVDEKYSADWRWEHETPYEVELITEQLKLPRASLLLDYGSGIGRLAKPMLETGYYGVVGCEISSNMAELSNGYVHNEGFVVCSQRMFDALIHAGKLRFDGAYSVWCIQHSVDPLVDIMRIKHSLKPDGRFFILNSLSRHIPARNGDKFIWIRDDKDVKQMLLEHFDVLAEGTIPEEVLPNGTSDAHFWMTLRPKP